MNTPVSSARESLVFYRNDPELAATLPAYPQFLQGVLSIPYGSDSLLFLGAKETQVIKGQGARMMLASLLPLLDGQHSIAQLSEKLPRKFKERVAEMLVLLSHKGLLADAGQATRSNNPLQDYIGRYVNVSRHFKNVQQAMAYLQSQHVMLVAAPQYLAELREMLPQADLQQLRTSSSVQPSDLRGVDYLLAIESPSLPSLARWARAAREAGVPCYFAKLSAQSIQIGPLFSTSLSASYACMQEQQRLSKATSAVHQLTIEDDEHLFWLSYICHGFVNLISKSANNPPHNCYSIFSKDEFGYHSELIYIAPEPSISDGMLAAYPALMSESARQAWQLHCRIRLPAKELIGPSIYLTHYSLSNRKNQQSARPCYHSDRLIVLPDATLQPAATRLSLAALAYLLKYSYGEHEFNETRRLLAPSGGALGSPDAYLYIGDVDGVAKGLYRYRSSEHVLEVLARPSSLLLQTCLGRLDAGEHQCYLFGVAAYARVAAKYGEMAFKHTNLDAGVMQAYLSILTQRMGLGCEVMKQLDVLGLMDLLAIAYEEGGYFLTHVLALGVETSTTAHHVLQQFTASASTPGIRGHQVQGLQNANPLCDRARFSDEELIHILLQRRAHRRFHAQAANYAHLQELLAHSMQHLAHTAQRLGIALPLGLEVVLPHGACSSVTQSTPDLASGLYTYDAGQLHLRQPLTAHQARFFTNQDSLAGATALCIVTLDMSRCLPEHGMAAYRLAFQACGYTLAHLWLEAQSMGYQGTIAGGVLDEGLVRFGAGDSYNQAGLAMFVYGHANLDITASQYVEY